MSYHEINSGPADIPISSEDKRKIFLQLPIGTKLTVISHGIIDLVKGEVVILKSIVYVKQFRESVDVGDEDLKICCVIKDRHGFMSEHLYGNFTCDAWEIFKNMSHNAK